MYYLTRTDYNKIISSFKIKPVSLPSLSFEKKLNENFALYIGWAIWQDHFCPNDPAPEEMKAINMIRDFLKRNLTIVEDNEAVGLVKKEW